VEFLPSFRMSSPKAYEKPAFENFLATVLLGRRSNKTVEGNGNV